MHVHSHPDAAHAERQDVIPSFTSPTCSQSRRHANSLPTTPRGTPSIDAGGKPILGSPSGQSDPSVLQSPRVQLINTTTTTDALGLPYSGASKFIKSKDDSTQTYVRPISTTPILENKGPRIFAYIENHCLPVLLDTGADITVMSKSQLQALVRPSMSKRKSI